MLLVLIKIALGLSAIYGFGMWLYLFLILSVTGQRRLLSDADRAEVGTFTFHLGICAIVAAGFLGIILVNGG
jgi:hypothetical protein